MTMLYVRCKKCRAAIATGIDVPTLKGVTLAANKHACPACRHAETYEQKNYTLGPPPDPSLN